MPVKIRRALTSPAWVTTEELADWWGMSPKSIGNMIRAGRLPGKLIGGTYIIPANVKRPERRIRTAARASGSAAAPGRSTGSLPGLVAPAAGSGATAIREGTAHDAVREDTPLP